MTFLRTSHLLQHRIQPSTRLIRRQAAPAFSTTSSRFAGKEGAVHEDAKERAQEAENAKRDQQQHAQKHGEGKFKEELTSESEGAVKADKGQIKDAKKDTEQMQKDTANAPREKHNQ